MPYNNHVKTLVSTRPTDHASHDEEVKKTKLFPFAAQLSSAESCEGNLCTHVLKTMAQGFFEHMEFQTLVDFDAVSVKYITQSLMP